MAATAATLAASGGACLIAALAMTRLVLALLRRHGILDVPNVRSSHSLPTPRGGGWGVVLTVVPAWLLIARGTGDAASLWIIGAAGVLVAVSWLDDLRGMPVAGRLGVQVLAVAVGVLALAESGPVFQGLLPLWADRLAAGLVWLWFINLFNFMDGIDGLSGTEAASIALGLALVLGLTQAAPAQALQAVTLGGAVLGFLWWNWHPARIFLGDVGSVPLGFLLGWLLLRVAADGLWPVALILPAYHLADATLTLLRRALRQQRVWQAHREHFYQQATAGGLSHAAVTVRVLALNLLLVALAVGAAFGGTGVRLAALAIAGMAVAGLLTHLAARPTDRAA